MNPIYGLGLPDVLPALNIFLPFFLQMSTPYSIKRGEKLSTSVNVFNQLTKSQDVIVSITKNDAEFVLVDAPLYGWKGNSSLHDYG